MWDNPFLSIYHKWICRRLLLIICYTARRSGWNTLYAYVLKCHYYRICTLFQVIENFISTACLWQDYFQSILTLCCVKKNVRKKGNKKRPILHLNKTNPYQDISHNTIFFIVAAQCKTAAGHEKRGLTYSLLKENQLIPHWMHNET